MHCLFQVCNAADVPVSLTSPDKRTELKIMLNEAIHYSIIYDSKILIAPSPLSITLDNGLVLGVKPKLQNQEISSNNTIMKTFYGADAEIEDNYNELVLTFKNEYSLVFRAYNNGVAYHFVTSLKGQITVMNEEAVFSFNDNNKGHFLTDLPSNYKKKPECIDFMASIPTVWDKTYPLNSKIGQYVTIARKKGDTWYVGSMTNCDERTTLVNCDFLDEKEYTVEIFQDGVNAQYNGIDYKRKFIKVKHNNVISVAMASGGGWAAKFIPVK